MSEINSNSSEPPLRPHNPVLPNNRFDAVAAYLAPRLPSDPPGVDFYFVAWTPLRDEPDWTLLRDAGALTRLGYDCVEVEHLNLRDNPVAQTHAMYRSQQLGATTRNYITRLYRAAATYFRSLVACDVQLCRRGGRRRSLELDFPEFVTTRTTPENLEWLDPPPKPAEDPPVAAP